MVVQAAIAIASIATRAFTALVAIAPRIVSAVFLATNHDDADIF